MKVSLKWITPEADKEVAHMARVSNPNAKPGDPAVKLIHYLLDHKHYSPFEMACMCVEIETTRDIARQILRHRSAHFQEFSQRYSEAPEEPEYVTTPRTQDLKNRQNSTLSFDPKFTKQWIDLQNLVWSTCWAAYQAALAVGVAKELARKLLPEGLVRTRMYMQCTLRDWIHYIGIRQGPETQLEHRQIAFAIGRILEENCPDIANAAIAANIMRSFSPNA